MSSSLGIQNENYIAPRSEGVRLNNEVAVGVIPPQGYPSVPPKPIVIQPNNINPSEEITGWTDIPLSLGEPTYPPALEYLKTLTKLTIEQHNNSGSTENHRKFLIKNARGDNTFIAIDDSSYCERICYGSEYYSINMRILDIFDTHLIRIHRPSFCFVQEQIQVYCPPNYLIGVIEKKSSLFYYSFIIKDHKYNKILRLEAPYFTFCEDIIYTIKSCDGSTQVGQVTKKWMGFFENYFTKTNSSIINFSRDLNINVKILLLAFCLTLQ